MVFFLVIHRYAKKIGPTYFDVVFLGEALNYSLLALLNKTKTPKISCSGKNQPTINFID